MEPVPGVTVSHEAPDVAVQAKVPPPVLRMASDCVAGLPLPCCAVNEKLAGFTPKAGGVGAAVTVSETGMVRI